MMSMRADSVVLAMVLVVIMPTVITITMIIATSMAISMAMAMVVLMVLASDPHPMHMHRTLAVPKTFLLCFSMVRRLLLPELYL